MVADKSIVGLKKRMRHINSLKGSLDELMARNRIKNQRTQALKDFYALLNSCPEEAKHIMKETYTMREVPVPFFLRTSSEASEQLHKPLRR